MTFCHKNLNILTYIYEVLTYADDNLIIERSTDVLLNACKDIVLAVNTGKTKYMEIGCNRGMTTNEHIAIGSNSNQK